MTDKSHVKLTVGKERANGNYVEAYIERRPQGEQLSPGYSITGAVWEPRKNARGASRHRLYPNSPDTGGAIHEELLKVFPRLELLINLHLSDLDGVPMHADANGWYFYTEQFLDYELKNHGVDYVKRHGRGRERVARCFRMPAAEIPRELRTEAAFLNFAREQRPRWMKEAEAADKLLEELEAEQ